MRALYRYFILVPVLIVAMFGPQYLNRLEITSTINASASASQSSGRDDEAVANYLRNSWTSKALVATRGMVSNVLSDAHSATTVALDTGRNVLLFGEWETGALHRLSNGQMDAYFSDPDHDLGFIRDIQIFGDTIYVSSVERQQEYQMLSRIIDGALDSQWPGLMGGIGLLPLSRKQLLSGGLERTVYPYKVTTTLALPSGQSFPQYTGKSAIKLARNSKGSIYVLDVTGGTLYKIECNQNGDCDWQNQIALSNEYPRAVQIGIDEQDRIVLGIAGVEVQPLNIPRNTEPKIVLLEDTGSEVRLLATKADKLIRFFFGPRGGLVVANGEVDIICTTDANDSIVRVPYDISGFGEAQGILSTDRFLSGLVMIRH